jgi:serine/threonine protein kinase
MSVSPATHETIGNYTIERLLAHGSMGHVYVALHTLTHARVALKVLRSDLTSDTQAEERFLREVRAAAHIGHDGIVKVYDAGRSTDGRLYLAMELLSGETLEDRMQRLRGQRLTCMEWILRVLPPLAAAHDMGIVHRDLKPANVFIARDDTGHEKIKLLDFGLARDTREKSGTETGIALGTPYYMSPEQALRPKKVGPASDVWSLGVMMYEVLSGKMPFDGETLHEVVINATSVAHQPLCSHEPQLDAALCTLVDDCLSKEPAQRPADARQLLARLTLLLESPDLREALERPFVFDEPARTGDQQETPDQIPFAATALSFSPRIIEPAPRVVRQRSGHRMWISAVMVLTLAAAGFIWALSHADSPRALDATRAPTPQHRNDAAHAPQHVKPTETNERSRSANGSPVHAGRVAASPSQHGEIGAHNTRPLPATARSIGDPPPSAASDLEAPASAIEQTAPSEPSAPPASAPTQPSAAAAASQGELVQPAQTPAALTPSAEPVQTPSAQAPNAPQEPSAPKEPSADPDLPPPDPPEPAPSAP